MTYATLDDVKSSLGIASADYEDDSRIEVALQAAEDMIDAWCDRSFAVAGTAATTRVYAAPAPDLLYVDDATAITLVEHSDGTTWTAYDAADWQAEPLNGRVGGRTVPYSSIRAVGTVFPVSSQALVRVTATWGWASVPAAVAQATKLQAARLFKRMDSPLGIAGGPDTGYLYLTRQMDADVQMLLAPYRRGSAIAGGIA